MQIPPTSSLYQSLLNTRSGAGERANWQPGQVVQARVVSNVVDGLVNLRIGATILTAQIDTDVKIGQKLALEVIRAGDQPLLQAVSQDRLQQLIEASIRAILPKQQSHAQLLSNLAAVLTQKELPKLPETVQSALKRLYQSIPDVSTLKTAEGIKTAINNSGLFLEAKLAQNNQFSLTGFQNDFKANLLRLHQALQQHTTTAGHTVSKQSTAPAGVYTNSSPLSNAAKTTPVFTIARQQLNSLPAGALLRTASTPLVQTVTSIGSQNSINPALSSQGNRFFLQASTPITTPSPSGAAASNHPVNSTSTQAPSSSTSGQPLAANAAAADKQTSPVTVTTTSGNPVNSLNPLTGKTLPAHISLQQLTGFPNTGQKIPVELFYPSSIPFKISMNMDNVRPSARFTKLDNLTKILSFFLKDAESSLARIQLNQLSHQHIEPEQKPSWVFEIPIKNNNNIDLFQFKVEKDQQKNHDAEDEKIGWTIQISFNILELGQVFSTVNIHQKRAMITFWSEQPQTVEVFNQHMSELQHELEDAGLVVDQLSCVQGCPPASFDKSLDKNILDEKV